MPRILFLIVVLFSCFLSAFAQDHALTENSVASENANTSSSLSKNEFIAEGRWRGVFKLKPELEVPFNFEIVSNNGIRTVYLLNGEEKFESGRLRQTNDSIFISLDPFDNELALGINQTTLSGYFRKQNKSGNTTVVYAEKDKNYRFPETGRIPSGNISGTYDITFNSPNGAEEKAVGLFTQQGTKLTATFLRITGDSRYLDGTVDGNNFYLSSFIGSGISFYKGSFSADGKLDGAIVGARGESKFTGTLNEFAALPDANKLTYLKEGYSSLDLSFPDVDGRLVSLKDKKYQNKIVILTITGTWCPNCIDEAYFLSPWFKKNHSKGIEIIALHYERQTDTAYTRKALTRFRNKYDIQYDQLIAGPADKQFVAASIPALNTFLSFPTIIVINKKGEVANIHTGFSGPATGKYYDEFVKEFNDSITQLLKQ